MLEMMNVSKNRVQNGVLDCPESKNEENFLSIELLDSSRYSKDMLRVLGGTRWTKYQRFFRISSLYAKNSLASLRVSLSQYQKPSFFETVSSEHMWGRTGNIDSTIG
ncbi:hypothetical protein E3N88_10550 [Mikania micrantha]|uniref:Uncharacterized protein n=1 Tax=Mikania micrantha TaxID=192012 RepID=A0A5N6PC16_9ASTR|nr:hypothetical protein E3N88_10550 [Mikania micrantha]